MTSTSGAPELFTQAVAALKGLRPRPELQLGVVRAPQRLAPWAYAFTAEINGPMDELATGRLILLHDPEGQEAWDGVLRLVVYLRAELDPEVADDPLLPAVGWSWLTDALENAGASFTSLGGTVTLTSSARFGDITGPSRSHDLELRGSWTAKPSVFGGDEVELRPHADAFHELMACAAGLPPEGVALLGRRPNGSVRQD